MVSVSGRVVFPDGLRNVRARKRDFRLPGLGSYLQTAASDGDIPAMIQGVVAMIAVIVLTDQLLWRPAHCMVGQIQVRAGGERVGKRICSAERAAALSRDRKLRDSLRPAVEALDRRFIRKPGSDETPRKPSRAPGILIGVAMLISDRLWSFRAVGMVSGVSGGQWLATLHDAGITFLRVNLALVIACLWTIPAGVAIASNKNLARIAQPMAQIAASVPATALFPIILLALIQAGGGLGIASILLMLLGTQWYILFNVIARSAGDPVGTAGGRQSFSLRPMARWRVVILPGIFPYLVTGLVTASGGAWNASIIAEYFHLNGAYTQQLVWERVFRAPATQASLTFCFCPPS